MTNDPVVFLEDDPATTPEATGPPPPAVVLDQIPFTTSTPIGPGEPDDSERLRLIRTAGTVVLAALLTTAVYLAFATQNGSDAPATLTPADGTTLGGAGSGSDVAAPRQATSQTSEAVASGNDANEPSLPLADPTSTDEATSQSPPENAEPTAAEPTTASTTGTSTTTAPTTDAPTTAAPTTAAPAPTTVPTTQATVVTTRRGVGGPLQVQNPGPKVSFVGSEVSEFFIATGGGDEAVRFSAENLPPGLELDQATGEVRGRPTEPGVFSARVTVSDATTNFTQGFTWVVVE